MLNSEIDDVRKAPDTRIGRVKRYGDFLSLDKLLKLYEKRVIVGRIVEGPVTDLSFVR